MFRKQLKLWSLTGWGDYCDGSSLIAASNETELQNIVDQIKKDDDRFHHWDLTPVEGKIIGIEPGVVHAWAYYE